MSNVIRPSLLLQAGNQYVYLKESPQAAGQVAKPGSTQSDALLVTLFVNSIDSGVDLSVSVYATTDAGKEALLISFPTITSPSTNLLLRKSAVTTQNFVVRASYTGVCDFEVYVRAIESAGESSVKILGPSNWKTSKQIVTTTPVAIAPVALTDRNGFIIRNTSTAGILYVSEDTAKIPGQAFPVYPGESFSADLAAGAALYGAADSGTIDVRISESGT
jgi:hypothetical protein